MLVAIETRFGYISPERNPIRRTKLLSHRISATSSSINRILLVRTDRLGDVVLTLPMLPPLRSYYPDAHIALLLNRYTGEIVKGNPYVNELLWYDEPGHPVPFLAMLHLIRSRHFDAAIVVHPTPRLACLVFLARIPLRIGSGYRFYSFLFNRRVYEHRKDAKRHEVEYNLRLLKELECPTQGRPEFHIDIGPEDQLVAEKLIDPLNWSSGEELVILHPGSGGSAREWPSENFAALASKLMTERTVKVLITGVKGDEEKGQKILDATGNSSLSLVGMLGLKELAALVRRSSLLVSNSTGPIHIAAAVGTPVVGLYPQITPMSAARWGPYTEKKRVLTPNKPIDCSECDPRRGDPCACMASITVEEVYNAATELLSRAGAVQKGVAAHER
jgi:heptosyltransferase-3